MDSESMARQSFVFYRSFYESLKNCPKEIQLLLYQAIVSYALDHVLPEFSGSGDMIIAMAVWPSIQAQLDANHKRWKNGCAGASYGKKGGAPYGNTNAKKQPQNNPKTTPNENVNDNVNDNVNVLSSRLNLPFSSHSFKSTWERLMKQPNWMGKSQDALEIALGKLSKYEEEFAIEMMEDTITNGWKGLEYNSTIAKHEQWKKNKLNMTESQSGSNQYIKIEC